MFKVELTREAHYSYSSDSVSFVLKWNDNVSVIESMSHTESTQIKFYCSKYVRVCIISFLQVHIEFNLLTQLYKSVPVPKPIYLCDDWSIVGEEFMVMEYVEVEFGTLDHPY